MKKPVIPRTGEDGPHLAFVVDDLDAAIEGKEILIHPTSPSKGVRVAFIVDNGAPVGLMQFGSPADEVWPRKALYKEM